MCHTRPNSSAPPRITSDQLKIDPKFLYIPPHRRLGTPGSGQHWRAHPTPRPPPVPPPEDNWRPSRSARDDDWDDDIITIITPEARVPRVEVQRDVREGEEGEVGADDEEVRAEAGGGEVEGGGGEGEEPAPQPRPAAAAQRPRRRPPREQWLLRQDQGAGQPHQPVGDQDLQPEDQPIEV